MFEDGVVTCLLETVASQTKINTWFVKRRNRFYRDWPGKQHSLEAESDMVVWPGTHLIFNYKGKNVLKKSDLAYKQEGDGTSHVYRLILKPDNTARVEIDGEKIYEGSLKEDWELLAPKDRLKLDHLDPAPWEPRRTAGKPSIHDL